MISRRLSLRWADNIVGTEDTDTIVLTGTRKGCFLDVRFFKHTSELDWALAGVKVSMGPTSAKWTREFDSRSSVRFSSPASRNDSLSRLHFKTPLSPEEANDYGTNTILPDGTVSEVGFMLHPATGNMTKYEEIWHDEQTEGKAPTLFMKSMSTGTWRAYVGDVQLAMGICAEGKVWAWQAERLSGDKRWHLRHATSNVDRDSVVYLPECEHIGGWDEGSGVSWNGEDWQVLEKVNKATIS